MPESDQVAKLRAIPLFADLDEATLKRVAASATEVEFPKGGVLSERGQPGSGMFVILDGTAKVELPKRTVELGPEEFVGELSLLTDTPQRSVRVCAVTELRCLALSRGDFSTLLASEPRLALSLLSVLAGRLVDTIGAGQPEDADRPEGD